MYQEMSFGNRSNYASLKDAFGVLEFEKKEEPVYTISQETQPQLEQPVGIESFTEITEEQHCKGCTCNSKISIKDWLNELLNIILISILLYIIVFKPKI